jgi:hypothetical protein
MDAHRPRSRLRRAFSSGPFLRPDQPPYPPGEKPSRLIKLQQSGSNWISKSTKALCSTEFMQLTPKKTKTVHKTSMATDELGTEPKTSMATVETGTEQQRSSGNNNTTPLPLATYMPSNDLQSQITDLHRRVDTNVANIACNRRAMQKQKLDGEVAGMVGKFRIMGYAWKVTDFKARSQANSAAEAVAKTPTTSRRKFIKMLMRVAFVNQGLIADSQNTDSLVQTATPPWGRGMMTALSRLYSATLFSGMQ